MGVGGGGEPGTCNAHPYIYIYLSNHPASFQRPFLHPAMLGKVDVEFASTYLHISRLTTCLDIKSMCNYTY